MTRRQFSALAAAAPAALSSAAAAPVTAMGVGTASYHLRSRYDRDAGKTPITETLTFAQYCAELGAGGIQAGLSETAGGYTKKVRNVLETHGMYFEASGRLPRDETEIGGFRNLLRAAQDAGASVMRTVLFPGRRYEVHHSYESYSNAATQAWKSLTLAEPQLRKRRMKIAIENHKNLRIPDMLGLMDRIQSEYVGVCVDFGNNYVLMEDAMDVAEEFAKYALSSHIKDHRLKGYEHGFLLEDVPLGEGIMDLKRMVAVLRSAQPSLKFTLETMTRDALEVPYLTDEYWAALPDLPGRDLAHTIATMLETQPEGKPQKVSALSREVQIRLEDENVRKGLAYGRDVLGL